MTSFEIVLRKLRIFGIVIILSLIVEIISLVWNHPLSLMAFLIPGGLLLAGAVITYFFEFVSARPVAEEKAEAK